MRPKSAGCGSLSECITHLEAQSPLTGHTHSQEAAESAWRFVFCRGDAGVWTEDVCGEKPSEKHQFKGLRLFFTH